MDVDSSGRILVAGLDEGSASLTTSNAQYPGAKYSAEGYLARISADGKTLQYSSYLRLDCSSAGDSMFVRAGPGDTAYIASTDSGPTANGFLLLRNGNLRVKWLVTLSPRFALSSPA